ncbi:MAG: S1/P1 nuclease [Alistipes sp.]|nr:S1/P1 nuclease [Alistipes sp.]MBQ3249366.1 S1/P1 nuclease [Alistipes sp.]
MTKRLFTLGVALCFVFSASAWGPKGHDTVAYIAEKHLSKRSLKRVQEVLDGNSLVYVANWLDNASHTDEYAHTKTWHYVNVDPEEGSYANSAKEPKGDIVVAINGIVERLKSGELSSDQERAELMMLIHLVGDMHCPMHAGYKSDRGGNGTQVKYFGKQRKLHSVWDSEIVESAHRWGYSEWQEQVDRATKKEQKSIAQGTPNEWIEETVALARDIYERSTTGENLSYDYVAYYTPIIEQQFLKGGIRLAALLEDIY